VLLGGHRLLVLRIEGDAIVEIAAYADPAVLAAFEGARSWRRAGPVQRRAGAGELRQ
jgi:hypothetical protein